MTSGAEMFQGKRELSSRLVVRGKGECIVREVGGPVGPEGILRIFLKPVSIGVVGVTTWLQWLGLEYRDILLRGRRMMTMTLPNRTSSTSDLNVSAYPGLPIFSPKSYSLQIVSQSHGSRGTQPALQPQNTAHLLSSPSSSLR